ncbi:hypothetical protein SDC9_69968 [bioreactor metagenome]|uniref:Uncharacterized protein n=1 Tax=bioreactor metagenome TaxID=1076179 RepID=A0A644YBI9_9ZZZZ
MVVAFRLERRSQTVPEVDDSGVFTGSEDDLRPPCGKMLQKVFRGLVAAVLRPHYTEDPEFAFIGLPSEGGFGGGEFFFPDAVFREVHGACLLSQGKKRRTARKAGRPLLREWPRSPVPGGA